MKLTIFNSQLPAKTSATPSSLASSKDAFEKKLAALRAATGRPERFISLCACAVHDRPFAVVYERSDPAQPFTIAGIYRDGEGEAAASWSAHKSASKTLPTSAVDLTGWRCPYCQNNSRTVACGKCGTTVCGGRTRSYPGTAEIFECRTSCGARGTVQDAESIKGIEEVRRLGSGSRSAPLQKRLPKPGQETLRLEWQPPTDRRLK